MIHCFSGGVELRSTPDAPTSDQLLRALFDDTDVGSLASGVGCDHVLAVLEDDLSSGELASDAMSATCNVVIVPLFSDPLRITNAYRIYWIDLSKGLALVQPDHERYELR